MSKIKAVLCIVLALPTVMPLASCNDKPVDGYSGRHFDFALRRNREIEEKYNITVEAFGNLD